MNPHNSEKELADEAMLLYNAISIRALQEIVTKVADAVLRFQGPKSKSAAEALWHQRDVNIRNLARWTSDLDPARASKLQEMLLKMNGEKP